MVGRKKQQLYVLYKIDIYHHTYKTAFSLMIKKSLAYFQCSNVLTGQCKDEVTSYSPLILVNLIVGSSNRNTNYSSILYKICSFFGLVVSTRRIYAT